MAAFTSIAGGTSSVVSTASGGKVTGFNNIQNSTPTTVAAANPQRQSITFHNPGTIDIFVYPTTNAAGGANAPTNSGLGGAFRVYANGGTLQISGECQQTWAAFSASSSALPLTVMESNI